MSNWNRAHLVSKYDRYKQHIGQVWGEWVVLDAPFISMGADASVSALCRCSCGTERRVVLKSLFSGRSQSCGCRSPKGKHTTKLAQHEADGVLRLK